MNCPRCGKDIDHHEPGAETDACVAECVMGWKKCGTWVGGAAYKVEGSYASYGCGRDWCPSDSGRDMLSVVKRMNGIGGVLMMTTQTLVLCHVFRCGPHQIWYEGKAATAPLAVCRAALKACAGEQK